MEIHKSHKTSTYFEHSPWYIMHIYVYIYIKLQIWQIAYKKFNVTLLLLFIYSNKKKQKQCSNNVYSYLSYLERFNFFLIWTVWVLMKVENFQPFKKKGKFNLIIWWLFPFMHLLSSKKLNKLCGFPY